MGKRDWKWCEDVVPFVMWLNESRKEYHRVGFSAQGCSSLGQAYAETSALGMFGNVDIIILIILLRRSSIFSDSELTYTYVCNAFRMKVSFVIILYLFYHIEV